MNVICLRLIFITLIYISLYGCGEDSKEVPSSPASSINDNAPDKLPIVTVIKSSPSDHEDNITINSPVVIELSQDYQADDILFELKEVTQVTAIKGQLSSGASVVSFNPETPLNYSSTYIVNISSAENATPSLEAHSFSFKTQAPQKREKGSFHPPIEKYGKTTFSIVPIDSVTTEVPTKVSFGIPFPKDFLVDINKFRLLDEQGDELSIAATDILAWHDLSNNHSIRAVLTQLELVFKRDEYGVLAARTLTLEWGVDRTVSDLSIEPARDSWVLVDDEEFPASDNIYEPQAYALFQPQWYGNSVIKTRLLSLNTHPEFSAYDVAFELFGDTAINHVDPRVTVENLISYRTSYAAWLFDRAMTIYQLAFRAGKLKYLRAAHRASQFYLQHINDDGYFSLKGSNDMKYSYGESLVADFILFGDERIPDKIEKMVPAWDSFNSDYTLNTNFWTERHAAFQLKGYVSAFELTGNSEYKEKAKSTFLNLKKMQASPEEGIPKTGGLMHTASSHGEGGAQFIASPWMSVLLIDAVERYNIHIEDNSVSDFVVKMGEYFKQEGVSLYEWKGYKGNDSFFVPYYLAGADLSDREHGGIGANDLEHGLDVTKIFSSAYFHSCVIGECNIDFLKTLSRLYHTVFTQNIPYWIRAAAPNSTLSSYRLAPPRKFNWWFNTTANNDFLLGDDVELPIYKENAPKLELIQKNSNIKHFKPGDEISFTFQLKNIGQSIAKNIVIKTSALLESPTDLLEVSTISSSGVNKGGEIVWHIDSLAPNDEILSFNFTVLVKDFPAIQSKEKPIGNIVSFAEVNYCSDAETADECPLWVNVWNSGGSTFKIQSNWLSIAPAAPVTPPTIEIISPIDFEVIDGNHTVLVEIEDVDGVAEVEFLLDGNVIKTLSSPPYQADINFDALSASSHKLTVIARDAFGSEALKSITVEAKNPDVISPQVAILSPVNQEEYCNLALVKYEVEDEFSIKGCRVNLNDKEINLSNCDDLTLSHIIPLFNAKAYLPFNEDSEIIESTNKYGLIGQVKGALWNVTTERDSLSFSGDDYVDFTTENLEISNNITVSFWLNPQTEEGMIMSQDWGYIGNEYGWAISLGANHHESNNTLSITWSSGTNAKNLNQKNVIQTPAHAVVINEWQHVVVRKNNKQVDIFINGELITSEELADDKIAWPFSSNRAFSLAKPMKHPDMYNQYYQGLLDDIAIWNEPLTGEDITQLYEGNSGKKQQKLTVLAYDNAGNIGKAKVDFSIKKCN